MTEAPFPIPSRPGDHRLPCPTCNKGKRDDALAVTVEADGSAVWFCHRCQFKGSTRTGPIEGRGRPTEPTAPAQQSLDKTERARRLIDTCEPATGTLVETYLASRLIELSATSPLLFTAGAWHWPTRSTWPAMVAPIVPIGAMEDEPAQAAHITFLDTDGRDKAPVKPARLYSGPKKGGVVKLVEDSGITTGLALAEGIETGLSAMMAGLPTWACLDAGNLAEFPVLSGIEALTVVADYDQAGLDAAEKVARRWRDAGREVRVLLPHDVGADFNDTAREVSYA